MNKNKIEVNIRNVESNDIDDVMRVEIDNFGNVATTREAMEERAEKTPDTFYIAEVDGKFAGYMEGAVITDKHLADELFSHVDENPEDGGYIAITSLSIDEKFQGAGIGDALIQAMKDLAMETKRKGITLTCHDYLIKYYEKKGFTYDGESKSNLGGEEWFNMIWKVGEK